MDKYLIGSCFLQLDNCRDEDYLYFGEQKRSVALNLNESYMPKNFFKWYIEIFKNGNTQASDSFVIFTLYQFSQGWRKDFPIAFEIFDFQKQWVDALKKYINLPETEELVKQETFLLKKMYHIVYQYYMIKEQKYLISEEGKKVVQQIHDLTMPAEYFFEIKKLINSL